MGDKKAIIFLGSVSLAILLGFLLSRVLIFSIEHSTKKDPNLIYASDASYYTYQHNLIKKTVLTDGKNYTYQLGRLPTEGTFKVEVDTTTRNIMTIIYKSREAGIDEVSALKIAICESRLDEKAQSKTSSGKGLYQFLSSTWQAYCKGDPLNAEDSTDCFIKLYPQHSSWWKCKG